MRYLPDLFENPFREFARLDKEMRRLLGGPSGLTEPAFTPSCDVEETDTHYLMSFDLPGVKKEDIKVDLRDNQLTVTGERKEERKTDNKAVHRMERFYGSFARSFTLPTGVNPDQVEANYADGVLRIAIPKGEAARTSQIKIGEGKPGFWDKLLGQKKEDGKAATQEKKSEDKRAPEKVA